MSGHCEKCSQILSGSRIKVFFRSSKPFFQLSSITKSHFLKDFQGNKNRIKWEKLGNFQAVFLDD